MENVSVNMLVVIVATLFCSAIYDTLKSLRILYSVVTEAVAGEHFIVWRYQNPGVYVGFSDEGKKLLRAWIAALDVFQKTHPWIDCTSKRAYLMSLLDELPPKSPNEVSFDECSPSTRFLLYTYRHEHIHRAKPCCHYS